MTRPVRLLAMLMALGTAFGASAETPDPIQQHNSSAVWFENWVGLSNATLTVSAPNGKVTQIITPSGTPVYELQRGEAMDGIYRYELRAATQEKVKIVNPIDNGRGDAASDSAPKPFYLTGHFTVSRGAIITPEDTKEEDG